MVVLDVLDHGSVNGAPALGVCETFTFASGGKWLAREAGYVDIDIWCRGGVTLSAVVESLLRCVVGLDGGANVRVDVTAENVVMWYFEVAECLNGSFHA